MGKLLCEKNLRYVWCRNESVRAEIGQLLHTHTHAAKLVPGSRDNRLVRDTKCQTSQSTNAAANQLDIF